MSAALVRQALEFVDEEESVDKRGKRGAEPRKGSGSQGPKKQKKGSKKVNKNNHAPQGNLTNTTIKKLLALSKPTVKRTITEKIVQRAIKRKPLVEKVEVKKDEGKSILFPDEPVLKAKSK